MYVESEYTGTYCVVSACEDADRRGKEAPDVGFARSSTDLLVVILATIKNDILCLSRPHAGICGQYGLGL